MFSDNSRKSFREETFAVTHKKFLFSFFANPLPFFAPDSEEVSDDSLALLSHTVEDLFASAHVGFLHLLPLIGQDTRQVLKQNERVFGFFRFVTTKPFSKSNGMAANELCVHNLVNHPPTHAPGLWAGRRTPTRRSRAVGAGFRAAPPPRAPAPARASSPSSRLASASSLVRTALKSFQ